MVFEPCGPHSRRCYGDTDCDAFQSKSKTERRSEMADEVKKVKLVEPAETEAAAVPDPFDIASLRLNPSFLETAGVKKLLTTVPARRPSPQDFVRVHPSPQYRENFAMIELKDDREDFL